MGVELNVFPNVKLHLNNLDKNAQNLHKSAYCSSPLMNVRLVALNFPPCNIRHHLSRSLTLVLPGPGLGLRCSAPLARPGPTLAIWNQDSPLRANIQLYTAPANKLSGASYSNQEIQLSSSSQSPSLHGPTKSRRDGFKLTSSVFFLTCIN